MKPTRAEYSAMAAAAYDDKKYYRPKNGFRLNTPPLNSP